MGLTDSEIAEARRLLRRPRTLKHCWRVGRLVRRVVGTVDERASVYGVIGSIAVRMEIDPDTLRRFTRLGAWPEQDIRVAETAGAPTRAILASLALDRRPAAVRERRWLLQRLAGKKITAAEFNRGLQNLQRQSRRQKPNSAASEFSRARSFVSRGAKTIVARLEVARSRLLRAGTPDQRRNIGALFRLSRKLQTAATPFRKL